MSAFSRQWLKLRENADLAARDPVLARRFAASLPRHEGKPVRIVDLGAGTGANCRALMPRIGGDQEWILIDRDRDLIAAQEEEFAFWARRQGYPVLAGGGKVTITAGASHWLATSLPLDLATELATLATIEADGVAASALFDLVSAAWLDRFAATIAQRRWRLLAALTVDGDRNWHPALREDEIVMAAFRRHQDFDKGFGPALGAAAAPALATALESRGFTVAMTASPWQLDHRHRALLDALIDGEAQAAREASPGDGHAIAAWAGERRAALAEGRLRLTLGHRDMLAIPG